MKTRDEIILVLVVVLVLDFFGNEDGGERGVFAGK
jgi:hypothetical protein